MFHGVLHDSEPDSASPALSVLTGRAYDSTEVFGRFQAPLVWHALGAIRSAIPDGESATTTPGWSATSAGPRTGSGSGSRRMTTSR
jgi:hypothetical protein